MVNVFATEPTVAGVCVPRKTNGADVQATPAPPLPSSHLMLVANPLASRSAEITRLDQIPLIG